MDRNIMPDRKLTKEELFNFINEKKLGKIFEALKIFAEENTEPTLHDLCIIELHAIVDAHTESLIKAFKILKNLNEEVLAIKARLYKLENKE